MDQQGSVGAIRGGRGQRGRMSYNQGIGELGDDVRRLRALLHRYTLLATLVTNSSHALITSRPLIKTDLVDSRGAQCKIDELCGGVCG
jgi:hypothetical protein